MADATSDTYKTEREKAPTLWRYYLPSEKEEGWAIILIGSDGFFSAISDFGDYCYFWSHHGCKDVRQFFLNCVKEVDYFAGKLSGGDREYDGDATYAGIAEYLEEMRKEKSWTKAKLDRERKLLEKHKDLKVCQDGFGRWLEETNIDDAYEYCVRCLPKRIVHFVQVTMARLVEVLKKDLAAEGIT